MTNHSQPQAARPRQSPSGGCPRSDRDMRRRTLSQNFLRQAGAQAFLDLVEHDPRLLCLEVGAGEGVLTVPLAGMCAELTAFEIDEFVAKTLMRRVSGLPNVRVVVGDFLAARPPAEPFHLTGNVPFSLTSAIIDWCLAAPTMTTATIITQLEYAKKRAGTYGRWSRLTVMNWPEYQWELLGKLSKTQFRPVPRIDAGVLRLTQRQVPLVDSERLSAYADLVELGFTGVGGTLFASLRRRYARNSLTKAFQAAQIPLDTVVAFVPPAQWLQLFAALPPLVSGGRSGSPRGRGRR